jgi:hypothetical protein
MKSWYSIKEALGTAASAVAKELLQPRELSILALAVGAFLVARSLAPEMALGIAFVAWGGLSLLTWFLSQLLALRTGKEREG